MPTCLVLPTRIGYPLRTFHHDNPDSCRPVKPTSLGLPCPGAHGCAPVSGFVCPEPAFARTRRMRDVLFVVQAVERKSCPTPGERPPGGPAPVLPAAPGVTGRSHDAGVGRRCPRHLPGAECCQS